MKKLLFILTLLFSVSSFAQTKEETIEWLNTNGKDFLKTIEYKFSCCQTLFQNAEITNDTLCIVENVKNINTVGRYNYYSCVKWNNVLYQDVNSVSISQDISNPNIKYFNLKIQEYIWYAIEDGKKSEVKILDKKDMRVYYNADNEENAKRTLKAIMHLAKLNGAKENKQTF